MSVEATRTLATFESLVKSNKFYQAILHVILHANIFRGKGLYRSVLDLYFFEKNDWRFYAYPFLVYVCNNHLLDLPATRSKLTTKSIKYPKDANFAQKLCFTLSSTSWISRLRRSQLFYEIFKFLLFYRKSNLLRQSAARFIIKAGAFFPYLLSELDRATNKKFSSLFYESNYWLQLQTTSKTKVEEMLSFDLVAYLGIECQYAGYANMLPLFTEHAVKLPLFEAFYTKRANIQLKLLYPSTSYKYKIHKENFFLKWGTRLSSSPGICTITRKGLYLYFEHVTALNLKGFFWGLKVTRNNEILSVKVYNWFRPVTLVFTYNSEITATYAGVKLSYEY